MSRRAERVSNLIRQEISELLQLQVNDPRLNSLISVTRVVTTDDLRQAKVYVSVLGDVDKRDEVLKGFRAASNYLRRELAGRLLLRRVPELSFYSDDSIEGGAKILNLIEQVAAEEREDEQ
jgi:ribosome-binding factor A